MVADGWPRKNGVKKITEQAVKNAALFGPGVSVYYNVSTERVRCV